MTFFVFIFLLLLGITGVFTLSLGILILLLSTLQTDIISINKPGQFFFIFFCFSLALLQFGLIFLFLTSFQTVLWSIAFGATIFGAIGHPFGLVCFLHTFPSYSLSPRTRITLLSISVGLLLFMLLPEAGLFQIVEGELTLNLTPLLWETVLYGYTLVFYTLAASKCLQRFPSVSSTIRTQYAGFLTPIAINLFLISISRFIVPFEDLSFLRIVLPVLIPVSFAISFAILLFRYDFLNIPNLTKQVFLSLILFLFALYIEILVWSTTESTNIWGEIVILIILAVLLGLLTHRSLKEVEERLTLQKKQTELSRLTHEKDRFLRTSSHQLRTPLTALQGYIEKAQDKSRDASSQFKHYLSQMHLLTVHMKDLIQQLLSFNSIEAESFSITSSRKIDIYNLIEKIKNIQLAIEGNSRDIEVILEGEEGTYEIIGDEAKLDSALTNIIHNAIVYTNTFVRISLDTTPNNQVCISIKDDGIGITEEEKSRIFHKFERGTKSQEKDPNGSGLGLFLAQNIITLHGGSIEVHSEGRGEGTEVIITLPRDPSSHTNNET